MSVTSDESYVEMEAGAAAAQSSPAPKEKKQKKPKKPAGPPDHVGEKLALIECGSILLIGISSYTIAEASLAGYYGDGGRYLKNDDAEDKNWKDQAKDQVSLFIASTFNATLLNYSLGVAVVTLIMCIAIRSIEKCRPGTLVASRSLFGNTEYTIEKVLAGSNAVWWMIGTAVMTFKGPYVEASNGYFAAWLGFIGSLLWAAPLMPPHSDERKDPEKSDKDKILAMIVLSSAVLIISLGDWGNFTQGNLVYGLLAAVLSVFLAAILGFVKNLNVALDRAISIVLALMWVFAAIFLAAVGPFEQAGNGMFSTWLGTLCSVRNLMRSIYKTSSSQSVAREEL
mmetsp:Transcript_6422/g.17934  ORF Transcript_6422/g.17934 Transcript_6422/m.17934 type:complete len:340 (+) Transcript_6422:93-1112(+)